MLYRFYIKQQQQTMANYKNEIKKVTVTHTVSEEAREVNTTLLKAQVNMSKLVEEFLLSLKNKFIKDGKL